ncbi:hypothetical protein HN954_02730 [bacterium]|jgi:polysaccharide pyruvyl transferase WcaK-like protein|nr:hypothetical protein [bacterium]MBT6831674.1 hypothetical protein [bacterium]MBT6996320.1 hypothetical protein [bacterium]MBT7772998.1 hypothetical protein [bacterium]
MKTLLIGNFGARNVGDELILAAALSKFSDAIVATADAEFSQKFSERTFETIQPFPSGLRSFFSFFLKKEFRRELRVLRGQVSKIIFPGGGLFAIRSRAFWIWGATIFWLKKYFPDAEIFLENQGIDEPQNFLQRAILKKSLRGISKISVRDAASAAVLKKLKIESLVVGDRVESWKISGAEKKKKRVLINSRARADFSKILKNFPDHEKIFVAMEPGDARFSPENWDGKTIFPETASEAIALFSSVEIAIGQRLHFLILAKKFGAKTFTLGDPYAEKVRSWCEKNAIEDFQK